jgi:hypothetical protein
MGFESPSHPLVLGRIASVVLNDFILLSRELLLFYCWNKVEGQLFIRTVYNNSNLLVSNPCRYREIRGNSS